MTPPGSFLEARGLSKAYRSRQGRRLVLDGVSLTVARGEFVSIVGSMGSGKSTLLNLLSGVLAPDAGTITVNGERSVGVRRDAGVVFQNYSLLPWLTALENVRLAVSAAEPHLPRRDARERSREALARVGLGNATHRRPAQLSGGMRQRVALARAFATRPRLLFLDEPFGALDALTRETLQRDLAGLCAGVEDPVTVVMVTNSVEEAMLMSDRILPVLPGPPATLGEPIPVPLARPRDPDVLAHDDEASRCRAHIVATLTSALEHRGRTGRAAGAPLAEVS